MLLSHNWPRNIRLELQSSPYATSQSFNKDLSNNGMAIVSIPSAQSIWPPVVVKSKYLRQSSLTNRSLLLVRG